MSFAAYPRIEAIAYLKKMRDGMINASSASGNIGHFLNATVLHCTERIHEMEGEIEAAIKEGQVTFKEVMSLIDAVNSISKR